MVIFLNTTETIGIIIGTATTTTTGSLVLTLSIIILILLAIAIMLGIPMEFTAIIILPLLLTYMSFYGNFVAIGIMILIYLALIFTRKFIFQ